MSSLLKQKVVPKPIKRFCSFQRNWHAVIQPLRQGKFTIEEVDFLSIPGEQPKSFVRIKEYQPGRPCPPPSRWPAYIAKVGSKLYPTESITEHLLTRIGELCHLEVAESQLRMVGNQVRFLSKYFLRQTSERLTHGVDVFKQYLDEEMVDQIAETKSEQEFYTFQTVCAALKHSFPDQHEQILPRFVEMLAFDALVGNNDRHPANWGVIVPIRTHLPCRFSPVFDTARALFWNFDEDLVNACLRNLERLRAYVRKSSPKIGWDNRRHVNHFDLIRALYHEYPAHRSNLQRFAASGIPEQVAAVLEEEFSSLMSPQRRHLIARCFTLRHKLYGEAIS
jgi:hypothetical protein